MSPCVPIVSFPNGLPAGHHPRDVQPTDLSPPFTCQPANQQSPPLNAQVISREMFNPQFSLFQPVPEGGTTFQVGMGCDC